MKVISVLGVYFREFSDGSGYELGILEDYGSYRIMNVGDFAYSQDGTTPWIYIGEF